MTNKPEKKAKVMPVETAEIMMVPKAPVRRVLKEYIGGGQYAACGNCGCRLVNVEERVKCKFCWYCGVPIIWK